MFNRLKLFNLLILLIIPLFLIYYCADDDDNSEDPEASTNDYITPPLKPLIPIDSELNINISAPSEGGSIVTVLGFENSNDSQNNSQDIETSLTIKQSTTELNETRVLITNLNSGDEIIVPLINDGEFSYIGYIPANVGNMISVQYILGEDKSQPLVSEVPYIYLLGINPNQAGIGEKVFIKGNGFSFDQAENIVNFPSADAFPDEVYNYSKSILYGGQLIEVTVPDTSTPGPGNITVTRDGKVSNEISFVVKTDPSVKPLEPVKPLDPVVNETNTNHKVFSNTLENIDKKIN